MQLMHTDAFPAVGVAYALPPEELKPYVSTMSCITIGTDAGLVEDVIYPEWGNVRFAAKGRMMLRTGPGPLEDCPSAGGIGPTSQGTRFSLAAGRYWSISLTPLGWSRFISASAAGLANTWLPVSCDGPFAAFSGLGAAFEDDDLQRAADRVCAELADYPLQERHDAERVHMVHAALIDPDVRTPGELAQRTGLEMRTLERFCASAFGFAPRLLLQRQRFLRSLSHFMLDPSLAWIETLDTYYHDQAHFIRDFKKFMGMTPGQYARMPHPVMWAAALARTATAGTPMQVLQAP